MDQAEHLAEKLEALLTQAGWTPGKLAAESRVSKATIDNWLRGRAARPRHWQPIAQVAAALELDAVETSGLLLAAGHPSVPELLEMRLPSADRKLLTTWSRAETQTVGGSTGVEDGGDNMSPAHLPVTRIPPAAQLPSGSRVHLRRNPYFAGRQALLQEIARALGGHDRLHGQAINTVTLTGMGGVGKTQLATEFAHRYGRYYPGGVYWLSFADPGAIPDAVAAAGRHAFMQSFPTFGTLPLDEQVRLVWSSWHDSVPRLVIFDECEDESLLQQWRPANGNTSVIVTSHRARWNPLLGVRSFVVDVLERSESIWLLQQYGPHGDEHREHLDAIAAILGDLPLAIHLAGTFLQHYRHIITPSMYLDELRRLEQAPHQTILDHRSLLEGTLSPTAHTQHVIHTFASSYDQLDASNAQDDLALKILAHAAIFTEGQPVTRRLLRATVLSTTHTDMLYAFEDALARLLDLALLQTAGDDAVSMHRLQARFVNARTLILNARENVEAALLAVSAASG